MLKSGNIECIHITSDRRDYFFIYGIPLHLTGSLIQSCKSYEWKELSKENCDQILITSNVKKTAAYNRVQYWILDTKSKKGYGANESGGNWKDDIVVQIHVKSILDDFLMQIVKGANELLGKTGHQGEYITMIPGLLETVKAMN